MKKVQNMINVNSGKASACSQLLQFHIKVAWILNGHGFQMMHYQNR